MKHRAGLFIIAFTVIASAKGTTFSEKYSLAKTTDAAFILAQGDINGDGLSDWVIEDGTYRFVSVIMNRPFAKPVSTNHDISVWYIRTIALGDVDSDGKLDILVGGEKNESRDYLVRMSVLFAGSDCSFGKSVDIASELPVSLARFADVDRDGDQDIIALLGEGQSLTWFENGGKGSSWTPHTIEKPVDSTYGSGGSFHWFETGDFDRDSATDFVLGYTKGEQGRLLFYRNTGGTFTKKLIANRFDSQCGAVGDIDRNGSPDLFLGKYMFKNSLGTFTKDSIADPSEYLADAVAVGDLNSDNRPDLVSGVFSDGIYVWQSADDGTYQRILLSNTGHNKQVAVSDVDNDGFSDIISLYEDNGEVLCSRNGATHVFQQEVLAVAESLSCFDIHDLDGDSIPDIIASPFRILKGTRTGSVPPVSISMQPIDSGKSGYTSFGFADFDGDGRIDIAYSGASVTGGWLRQTSMNDFTGTSFTGSKAYSITADIDADGDPDIFGRSLPITGSPAIPVYQVALRNSGGIFTCDTLFRMTYGSFFTPAVADFNHDGSPDIVTVSNDSTPQKHPYLLYGKNRGDGTFDTTHVNAGDPVPITMMIPFDADRDDAPDLLYANGQFCISRNSGGSFEKGIVIAQGGPGRDEVAAGDIDRDGRTDVVLFNDSTKELFWMRQDTSFGFISKKYVISSKATGNIRVYDFDGDGWLDILCLEGKRLVFYRNRLGLSADTGDISTVSFMKPAEYCSRPSPVTSYSLGRGRFSWRIPGSIASPDLSFFLVNGKRLPAKVRKANEGMLYAEFDRFRGVVLWVLRDEKSKIRGSGHLSAGTDR